MVQIVKHLKRNIKLINKYGKMLELSYKDLQYGPYKKKVKGFL